MGISQRGNGELQVQADNYLTELEANPVWIEHDLPLVPSYNSPMSTDPSFHNRPNYSTFYPNDRTGQQPLAKSSSIEDAKGMERIKQISCYLHSNQMNIFGNSGGDIIMPRFAFVSNPGQRNQFQPDTKALMINILPEEERRNFINKSKSIHPEVKNAAADRRSNHQSTEIKLYRNIIRNETGRVMINTDIVGSETEQLFGLERSWIFFDLLDGELFHCGPAGAISDFVPNMARSSVRQHVISFFELVSDMMNRLMTLLLGCPDSKRLQQMPEKIFISLVKSIIDSSLKAKAKERQRLSSKETRGTRLIMVDSEEFARTLGEEMPEDVFDRLRHGYKMVVHKFVDTRLERKQASERRENRPVYSIFFPSDDCLFIYIPTENGSYWHQADMQRANRLSRLGK